MQVDEEREKAGRARERVCRTTVDGRWRPELSDEGRTSRWVECAEGQTRWTGTMKEPRREEGREREGGGGRRVDRGPGQADVASTKPVGGACLPALPPGSIASIAF